MLSGLRDAKGGLSVRGRVLAAVVALAMLGAAAPLAISIVRWIVQAMGDFLF